MTRSDPELRNAAPADFPGILRLNAEAEHYLSPLGPARLVELDALAAYQRVVVLDGVVVAFLLGFREGVGYDSPNYLWFAARQQRFLYVDRIVVSLAHQGNKYGALLYTDLFAFARESGAGRRAGGL